VISCADPAWVPLLHRIGTLKGPYCTLRDYIWRRSARGCASSGRCDPALAIPHAGSGVHGAIKIPLGS
jgi:hypothetical protein